MVGMAPGAGFPKSRLRSLNRMPRSVAEIAADFDALAAHDFDYAHAGANGWERLEKLCDEMRIVDDPAACAPVMFRTMERLDGVDLGTPGPLVHTLEIWRGRYETLLAESVRRKPTPLSVWMVNRILNAGPPDAKSWMALLRSVAENANASDETKAQAEDFIEYQAGRLPTRSFADIGGRLMVDVTVSRPPESDEEFVTGCRMPGFPFAAAFALAVRREVARHPRHSLSLLLNPPP
jgi:hypothetical protein